MRHDNSELLRVNKDLEKILERLCAEKTSKTSNKKDLPQRCEHSKAIETVKDQLRIRIGSPSTHIKITWCQENEANVVLYE